jgi:hypothetical protein
MEAAIYFSMLDSIGSGAAMGRFLSNELFNIFLFLNSGSEQFQSVKFEEQGRRK